MASVLGTKVLNDDKIVYNIIMNKDEALQLKGHTENILVLAEDAINITSRISLRGKNDATKYFLIPRELRKDIKKHKNRSDQMTKMHLDMAMAKINKILAGKPI